MQYQDVNMVRIADALERIAHALETMAERSRKASDPMVRLSETGSWLEADRS